MKTEKNFPNGFSSWQETHFEIVQAITLEHAQDKRTGLVAYRHEAQGIGGLYELAEELTDEWEALYEIETWEDIGYLETLENWLNEKLNS
jgi:hypothetical protein